MEEKYDVDIGYDKQNQSYIKESEPIYTLQLDEINELIKKLNTYGLILLKANLKGMITQKEFLED